MLRRRCKMPELHQDSHYIRFMPKLVRFMVTVGDSAPIVVNHFL